MAFHIPALPVLPPTETPSFAFTYRFGAVVQGRGAQTQRSYTLWVKGVHRYRKQGSQTQLHLLSWREGQLSSSLMMWFTKKAIVMRLPRHHFHFHQPKSRFCVTTLCKLPKRQCTCLLLSFPMKDTLPCPVHKGRLYSCLVSTEIPNKGIGMRRNTRMSRKKKSLTLPSSKAAPHEWQWEVEKICEEQQKWGHVQATYLLGHLCQRRGWGTSWTGVWICNIMLDSHSWS